MDPRQRSLARLPLLLAALGLLAACGTTVATEQLPAAPGQRATGLNDVSSDVDGLGAAPAAGALTSVPGAPTTIDGATGVGTNGAAPIQAGTTTQTGGGPAISAAQPRGGDARIPGRGPGVTDRSIKVGLLYIDNAGSGVNSLGVQGYSQGDEVGEFRALVADLNKRGGVAGRTVEVVPRDCGQGCTTGDPGAYQAACTYFSQDSPVFIVFSSVGFSADVSECLAKKGIGFTVSSGGPPERIMRGKPVYVPDDISLERYARLLPESLAGAGWFSRDTKIGIVRPDTPDYARVTKDVMRPALVAVGANIVTEESGNDPTGIVFRLQQKGVTHVVLYGTPLFLMTAAETQQYRPWWSVSSMIGPGAFLQGSAPREQLRKTAGPGWQPGADVDEAHQPPANAAQMRCLEILRKANYRPTGTPRAVALIMCGELFHFEQVMLRVPEVAEPAFRASAERLPPYVSPITFALDFSGGRHHGASRYRLNRYQESCACYQYAGPLRAIA